MNKVKIKGKNDKGKKILILTGIHGNEITPVHAGYLLSIQKWDKTKFKTLTILNGVNKNGLRNNTREVPNSFTDDLNRMFSNDIDKDLKETLEKFFIEADVVIDIHSSPHCTEMVLINQDEYGNSYVEFCEKNHLSYLLRYSSLDTIKKHCYLHNLISFTIEINGMDMIDAESSVKGSALVTQIIENIDKFESKIEKPKYETYIEIYNHKEGIFLQSEPNGSFIKKGTVLGEIIDTDTFESTKVKYQKDFESTLINSSGRSYVTPNEPILYLQPINNIKKNK